MKNLIPLETKFSSSDDAREYLEKIGFESEDGKFWFIPGTRKWAVYMEDKGIVSYFYNRIQKGKPVAHQLKFKPPKRRKSKVRVDNSLLTMNWTEEVEGLDSSTFLFKKGKENDDKKANRRYPPQRDSNCYFY